jgi:Spy/CpxP family protein refolding chaperone
MKNFINGKIFRTVLVLLCGAGLAMSAAVAQQDTAPPPANGQQQAPPANGAMQGPQGGQRGMNPERQLAMMQQQLALSDDQTAQIRQILTEASGKMEALRANTDLAQEDRRAQMMTLRQGVQARIHAVLTPDQVTKYDAMQERMRQRRGAGGDGASTPQSPQQ